MKLKERDDLLVRLDERTANIWRVTELQEQHLRELNGSTRKIANRVTIVETRVEERTASKISKKAIAGYSSGGLLLLTLTILQIIQAIGG